MKRKVTLRELRIHSAAVLREVQAGYTIVVTRNGTAVAELHPLQPRRFVPRATLAAAAVEHASRIDPAQFCGDLATVIDQRIDE